MNGARSSPAEPSCIPNRWRRLALAAGLLLAAPFAAQADGSPSTPILSSLPWRSGASNGGDCLAGLRNRALDANISFMTHKSFANMVSQTGGSFKNYASKAPLWVVTLPLLADNTKGQFAQCAAGAFDSYWPQIASNLQSAGAQGTVVRLGHEANIGSHSHAWGVDSVGQIPAYLTCWRRVANLIKTTAPNISVEWTMAKKGKLPVSVVQMYPGDDVVDIVGVHYYDTGPQKNTQAIWDKYYMMTHNGGPWGVGQWLAFAKSHGKKLAVSEWALWQQPNQSAAAADDPVYISNMYRFFSTNADSIAYETYFNNIDKHQLCPGASYPKAASMYATSWSLGQ